MKKSSKILIAVGAGVVLGYSIYKGKGIFNKIRFKRQFEALENYVDTHYPDAKIGAIVPFETGWNCTVTRGDQTIAIHMVENNGTGFMFNPVEM